MATINKTVKGADPKVDFGAIVAPLEGYLKELDQFLKDQVELLEPEVQSQVAYILNHSGKRLRPILVALSGWDSGLKNQNELIRLGAILELVHLATLVHDDILDEASIRHGHPTAANKYGKDAAVLIGDILFAHALCLASDFETTEVCRAVALATSRVCSGEISQTYSRQQLNFDRAHYYRVIELKTAELFRLACEMGAKVAGKSETTCNALRTYGIHLGCAYQIFDDVVDLFVSEAKAGKTLGTDLQSGKFTLPLLVLIESLPEKERLEWIESYQSGDPQAVALLVGYLSEYPVLASVKEAFNESIVKARSALNAVNSSEPVAKELFALIDFLCAQFEAI
jgi:octaprenyl-diphosphate synthase